MTPVNVLIVDDSPTMRQLLVHMINEATDMRVVGEARDGKEAIKLAHDLHPDVILMDIVMPQMDGLQATREIMHTNPIPIVMVTASLDKHETDIAFRAIRLGALTVMHKPLGPQHPDFESRAAAMINAVRAMAGVKVIHHTKQTVKSDHKRPVVSKNQSPADLVAIAVSTGGPAALSTILRELPADYSLPIVVAQHISADFLPSLIDWLDNSTPLKVRLAKINEHPQPGHVYFAPGDAHLMLTRKRRFLLDKTPGRSTYMPSGDVLLESVATAYGANSVGVVLTGMGNDGAYGLRKMYDAGAHTIAQDEASSVVYGMPQEAYLLGATHEVLSIKQIATALASLEQEKNVRK